MNWHVLYCVPENPNYPKLPAFITDSRVHGPLCWLPKERDTFTCPSNDSLNSALNDPLRAPVLRPRSEAACL